MDMAGEIDTWAFRWINAYLVHPALDDLMVFLTMFKLSSHLFLLAALYILVRKGRRGIVVLAVALLAVAIADYTASGILKPLFQRIRPCFVIDGCRLLIDQSRSYSFASSHAANSAAVASVVWIVFSRGALIEQLFVFLMVGYAFLVGYSRIYVGVHYPGDVLAGIMIGCASGLLAYMAFSWAFKNVLQSIQIRKSSSHT
ncbi:MAG: phosphatase PAP2 family protein [Chlorobium sp.]|uniref:phosphatase PAP2 family protein n=1 Tax=Chlorobium sp. TaxID=1095 RepID=UPI0025C54A65|nr:phosphatase PAP2 family protein [Chlorobium sp.]MCF8216323.1 phosphatase PAP2 family protein [Chlorobium sp.]MCF8271225.1 phosphatase PAP2 family protein [Chlorobium sp.]MCF8287599.1 phosphatase PAP2 family protein [Chlorobium sp.]MCF8291138.1 phosphatase PAP2 family protein [Chlorobium sp.]MCF8385225.1 phosphatase PAP2 family protein [Chlorobium sp.]